MTDEEQSQEQPSTEQTGGLLDKLADVAQTAKNVVAEVGETVGDALQGAKETVVEIAQDVRARLGSDDSDEAGEAGQPSPTAEAQDVAAEPEISVPAAYSPAPDSAVVRPRAYSIPTLAEASATATERDEGVELNTPHVANEAELPTTRSEIGLQQEQVLGAQAADAPGGDDTPGGAVYEPTEDDEGRPRRIKDLEVGMELEGRVTSTALYGIFVDIGVGRDGLVHISEMSDRRIESPTELVQIGDTVMVRIKSVDPETRRISLTMRSPRPEGQQGQGRRRRRQEVDSEKLSQLQPGDLVEGTISGLAPFGVFVDIGVGKDGLVHVSELSNKRVEKPEDAVAVGETHQFRILEVDPEGTRISLSLRRASEDFQERPRGATGGKRREREVNLEGIEPGKIMEGTISGMAPFGAFVDLGVGRDGLVHISELGEGRVAKVEDAVKVGDKVQVRVLGVDPDTKRISLSLRLEPRVDAGMGQRRSDGGIGQSTVGASPRPSHDRFQNVNRDRPPRRGRDEQRPPREPEVYVFGADEEEPEVDNATLDDLISKFGGASSNAKKGKARRAEREELDEDDEDFESQYTRRQRDAIRRTLGQGDEE